MSHLFIYFFLYKISPTPGKSVRSWCDMSSDRSFIAEPLSYFAFRLVFHYWCNKSRGMLHIRSGFPLSLSEWSFTIFRRQITVHVLSASLNKTFPSFLPSDITDIFFLSNFERKKSKKRNLETFSS